MTRQEVERMLLLLQLIAEHLGNISSRLDALCGKTGNGDYLRVLDQKSPE